MPEKSGEKPSSEKMSSLSSSTTDEKEHLLETESSSTTTINQPTKSTAVLNILLSLQSIFFKLEPILGPIILTLLSTKLRTQDLAANDKVIWDEAHFGKFGSYYLQHEFYHDVHPPLGKMLCGLSEHLAGYNGSTTLGISDSETPFIFESGKQYPKWIDFTKMRLFQSLFASVVVPVCYYTCKELKLNLYSTYFVSLMCCLENSYIALSKFILLDSFLLLFTCTTFYCLAKIHSLRNDEFSLKWTIWMILTGLSIGCVCSVKWVGLFVTALVGLYTILDLWLKFWDSKNFKLVRYVKSWVYRIVSLILIPFLTYLIFFKIHFSLLYKPGTGSGSMSSIFQANLQDTDIGLYPRNVQLGSRVTLRSQGLSSNLLHSHNSLYPGGSTQQQITTYGFKDSNNDWFVRKARTNFQYSDDGIIRDGDVIRLQHALTNSNLHSHDIRGHVSKEHREVSGYGDDTIGDSKDDWQVEILKQLKSSNGTYSKLYESYEGFNGIIHPVTTTFRLRHVHLGCYLATTGKSYPAWGFKQGEVICMPESPIWKSNDKSTWWNVESHIIEGQDADPTDQYYKYPNNQFLSDFVAIQYAMMASNNALTPDPDKYDSIASQWWEWPILRTGLRMCGWGGMNVRYYLMGNPFNTWFTSACILISCFVFLGFGLAWQRQFLTFDTDEKIEQAWWVVMNGLGPLLGWGLHYLPFAIMGRVTYYHHYMPALYFAMFVAAFVSELFTSKVVKNAYGKALVYLGLYALVSGSYWYFSPVCMGMRGPVSDYDHLKWLSTWEMGSDNHY